LNPRPGTRLSSSSVRATRTMAEAARPPENQNIDSIGPTAGDIGCVLHLSCVYSGIVLGALLTIFVMCLAIFYMERRQRARYPDLPSGRILEPSSPAKKPGTDAKILSESILQDARRTHSYLQLPSMEPPPQLPSMEPPPQQQKTGLTNSTPSLATLTRDNGVSRQHAPSTNFSSRTLPPRAPLASSSQRLVTSDEGCPLTIGMEVLVESIDSRMGWCGRYGSQSSWFQDDGRGGHTFNLSPGDVVTVVGVQLNSWCGACRGMTAYYTLVKE
jgi:hypothetical protein